jgi:predicted ATPase
MTRRQELRDWRLALLTRLANLAANAGEYEEAEQCRRAILAIDPCREDAAGALMASLAARGHRSDALRVYQVLAAALDELGLVPDDEIEALRAGLQKIDPAFRAEAPAPIHRGYLPVPLTSFVGRAWEVGELSSLLTRPPAGGGGRLLTLTGAAGCGKTRLALVVAAGLIDHTAYADGVWLVELAAIGAAPPPSSMSPVDSTPVEQALPAVLGLREETGKRLGTLHDFLRPRRTLILLDNCEHLADACVAVAANLLSHCPDLRILATSRAPLGMVGETIWHLSPLATPPLRENPSVEDLSRYEATRLFLDRALAARPTLALGDDLGQLIGRICHSLDGLPLAIELAAARLTTLPPGLLAERLDDCLGLLRGGNRAALPRQQTLESTMDWSYALLAPEARLLLQRLAVFNGGWTRAAAEAVCADPVLVSPGEPPALPREAVADLLAELVSWSLVTRNDGPEESRYGFLETVRQYAYARLAGSGEEQVLRERHGFYYLAEAERASKGLLTPERDRWMDLPAANQDNLRAALAWSVSQEGNGTVALSLAAALASFWLWRG